MDRYLLVDGYNIIHAWDNLKALAEDSLDHARKTLIDTLINLSGLTNEKIIIVFDAHKVNGGIESTEDYNKVMVVYTKEKETADTYIERHSKILAKKYFVRVATQDLAEQVIIIGSGAYVLSPKALAAEIESAECEISKAVGNKAIKTNLLMDNIDKKTARLLEEMRLNKNM